MTMRSPRKPPASDILNSEIAPVVKSVRVQPVPQGYWVVIEFHTQRGKGREGWTVSRPRMVVGEALASTQTDARKRRPPDRGSPATCAANPAGEEGNDG